MKKIFVLFSIALLASSCVKQMEEQESAKIAGTWVQIDEDGLTDRYIKFEHGTIAEYSANSNKFFVADKSVWGCAEGAFKSTYHAKYSLIGETLYYDGSEGKLHIDDEVMTFNDKTYLLVENFCPEYYSTITLSDPTTTFAFVGSNVEWPYTITNPVEGFALKVTAPSWVKDVRVTEDKISFSISQATTTRTGTITLSYPSAEDLKTSVTQTAEINLDKASVTLGYAASSSSFTYAIPDPQPGYTLKVEASHDWITDVKDNGTNISFSVKENNSGRTRTGKITLTYGGISNEFTVTQTYSASSISFTPSYGSHDYTSVTYNFKYAVSNPREGQKATVSTSDSWITGVTDTNGTVSYKVAENNSGSSRTGKITVTYAGVSKEFTVKQEKVPENLSLSGTANCYVVSETGSYFFKSVKGNSSTSVGTVSSVAVLWESFGTNIKPNVGDLIKSVSYSDGYIAFKTADNFKEGNAVIAAKDASGEILWSWHIWFTDQPQGQEYFNNAGTMMDRNLGATSATPGDVGALGLLYQWGRKDPFLGSSSISDNVTAKSTISWPSTVESNSSTGTISYATAHPTTFITGSSNGDWYYTGSSSTDNTRWTTSSSAKSIYDPCPVGWRVPDGRPFYGVWSKALGTLFFNDKSLYNSTNEGMNFSDKFGSDQTIWYPASGFRDDSDGRLYGVGYFGNYWSASPDGSSACLLNFDYSGLVLLSDDDLRARGLSVRCLQESK